LIILKWLIETRQPLLFFQQRQRLCLTRFSPTPAATTVFADLVFKLLDTLSHASNFLLEHCFCTGSDLFEDCAILPLEVQGFQAR
jgi:hypothetical protein